MRPDSLLRLWRYHSLTYLLHRLRSPQRITLQTHHARKIYYTRFPVTSPYRRGSCQLVTCYGETGVVDFGQYHGIAPGYLTDAGLAACHRSIIFLHGRSSSTSTLAVPPTRPCAIEAFRIAAARTWNSLLPAHRK